MKWQELSGASANVLERCWSIHHDKPLSFDVHIGQRLYGKEVTLDTYNEILEYQKTNPCFQVELKENRIFVKGICNYGCGHGVR